jgi:hypothetical protein
LLVVTVAGFTGRSNVTAITLVAAARMFTAGEVDTTAGCACADVMDAAKTKQRDNSR